jgi:hypothetical protein
MQPSVLLLMTAQLSTTPGMRSALLAKETFEPAVEVLVKQWAHREPD